MYPYAVLQMLVLLSLATGVPLAVKKLLGDRLGWPLDGNFAFVDGRPLFGPSKTLRGVVLAILAVAAAAPLLGLDWTIGGRLGALAMLGDLAASFTKRRLGRPPSSRATGLDQIPEALFPLVGCRIPLGL